MTRLGCALILSLVLGACSLVNDPSAHQGGGGIDAGRDQDGGTDAGPVLVQASEFCEQLAALQCYGYFHCCGTAPEEPSDDEIATCVEDASLDCSRNELSRLLTDRRTGYDARVAAEVLAEGYAIAERCSNDILAWFNEREGFQRVLTGTVAGGDQCTPEDTPGEFDFPALFSCQGSDRACVIITDRMWSCLARQGVGGGCILYWDCEDGLRCDSLFFGARGTCRARLPDGAVCRTSTDCESLICNTTCQTAPPEQVYCNVVQLPTP